MLFLTLLLLALPSFAQITSLATVYDGSRLYLTTDSPLRSSVGPIQGRVFVMDADGLRLFRERQKQPGPSNLFDTYSLSSVELSSDGGVLSYTGRSDCSGFDFCSTSVRDRSTVETFAGKPEFQISGFLRLSPNGRFAYRDVRGVVIGAGNSIVDLSNGAIYSVATGRSRTSGAGRFLSNDGSVVDANGGVLQIQSLGGSPVTIYDNPQERILQTTISADSQRILFTSVWATAEPQFLRLRLFDRQTQQASTLLESSCDASDPVWSDNAEIILFRCAAAQAPPQAWIIRSDGSGLRQITDDFYGIQKAILSGDGKVVFAHTLAEGILRIDLASGAKSTLLPNTFTVKTNAIGVPGSAYNLEGTLLSLIRGIRGAPDAPILARSETSLTFQVPWETKLNSPMEAFTLDVDSVPDYPFANPLPRFPLPILSYFPAFYAIPAISQNFDHFVSPSQPAAPGDVVHLFARGLGAVDTAVSTGVVTPQSAPFSRATQPFVCSSLNRNVPVLFAGLAPGTIGVYQVTIQIPPDAVASPYRLNSYEVACNQSAVAIIPFKPNP